MIDIILSLMFFALIVLHASWIVLFFYNKKETNAELFPNISVVIPAHNEEKHISDTIKGVVDAYYSGEREIIVVNDGSTDRTEEIVNRISEKNKDVRIYKTMHAGKANAINLGIRNAKNEIIIALDGDSEIDKKALVEIVKPFYMGGVGAVSGIIRAKDSRNPITWFQDFEYILSSGWRFLCNKINGTYIFPGFAAFRRGALLKIGGFNRDTFSEDFDVGLRLKKAGYDLVMSSAIIYTKVPETIGGLIKQRVRWGRGTIQVMKKHMDIILNRKYGSIGLYGIPTQIYWYVHGFVYIPIFMYQVFGGYFQNFVFYKNFFSFEVLKYFFSWFSMYGMIEVIYKTISGVYDTSLLFFLLISMFVLYLLYITLLLMKMAKPKPRHLFVMFFFFPYSMFALFLQVFPSLYEIYKPCSSNVWEKSQ